MHLFVGNANIKKSISDKISFLLGASFHAQTQWRDKVQESLGRYTLSVLSLRQKLNTESANLTDGEKRRRESYVSGLEGREKQLRLVFQQQQSGAKQKRSTDDQRKRLLDSAIIGRHKYFPKETQPSNYSVPNFFFYSKKFQDFFMN